MMSAEAASWVQASAALVALLLSGLAIWRQSWAERSREKSQARGIAVAIYPELLKMDVGLERATSIMRDISASKGHPAVALAQMLSAAKIGIPPMMRLNLKRLHWLPGDAGPTVIQLVSVTMQFDELVDSCAMQIKGLGVTDAKGHVTDLAGHLKLLTQVLTQAQQQVGPIHDG
jgi:hypothetical protein